ncbi:DUF1573 domain-containing protein [Candidatus Gottesmanbacteria bacterium]|nr:DUF1573 domain-containing protein [Candidatus Gottesmanbacteria bacterium]
MSTKTVIMSVILFFVAIIGLAFFMTSGQKPEPAAVSFTAQDADRPKVEMSNTFFDMGEISVSDVKQQDFTFKNVGTKPLQILGVNSSCGCTAGQILYKGEASKEFSMHLVGGYVTDIAAGDTATVRLTYRPATMPVYGLVEREVYVTTNDPANQKLVFSIKAKVK